MATTPRTEALDALASAETGLVQLAPPYSGTDGGIQRSRVYPSQAPDHTWMAVRINLAGQIVAQLGSRPTGAQSNGIGAGYQFTQSLDAGNHFWIATLRTVSVSRLPPERARAFGVLDLSRGEQPVDLRFQSLVPDQTHRFSIVQFQLPKGTYQITCGVLVDLQFRAGQTAYVEAIAKLESLIYIPPPATAAGETVTRRAGDDFVHGLLAELEPRAVDEEVVDGLD